MGNHASASQRTCARPPGKALLRGLAAVLLGLLPCLQALALTPDKPYRDYVVDTWDVAQGLPQISVMAITQDAEGRLWLATQAGLARFDGVRFEPVSRPRVLGLDNMAQALLPDRQGRLWIGTPQGLLVLAHGQLRTVPADPIPSARRFPVNALALAGDTVLAAGPDGVYSVVGERLRRLHALPGPVTGLLVQGDTLWAGSPGQVTRIQRGQRQVLPFPAGLERADADHLVWCDGTLWAGTRSGLLRLRDQQWDLVAGQQGERQRAIEALACDRDGNLWLATPHYLERLFPGRPPEHIEHQPGSRNVRVIFEDREGSLWTGSLTDGLARIWNGRTRLLSTPEGLTSALLWTVVASPDGSVLAGSSDGVARWQAGRFTPVVRGSALPHPDAYSLLAEPDALWIGTRSGVAILRRGQRQPERPPLLAPLQGAQVHAILRTRDGALWFGTTQGAFRLWQGRLQRYDAQAGLTDPRVRILYQTRDGRLLLGTTQGLYAWQNGTLQPIGRQTGLPDGVGVTALLELDDGGLVLGGDQHLWLYAQRRWHELAQAHDLPSNTITHLAEIGDDLWVAGTQGIYRLPLRELRRIPHNPATLLQARIVINSGFDRPGGQPGKCCNGVGNGRGLLRDGLLWLPTREGVLQVSAAPLPAGPAWPLRIERVVAGQQTFLPEPNGLRLPLEARSLKIEFSAPALDPARLPDLYYRLVGHDHDWQALDTPGQRSIAYAGLAPGDYLFELVDRNPDAPLAGPARLRLHVPAHFYETKAFAAVLAMVLAGLVFAGYHWLQYRYRRQREKLEHLVQERTQALQEANARLEQLSFTDPLTGLHNRRYLTQQMPLDLAFYARDPAFAAGREALVLALLDVDHFKRINDTWGHAAGDQVLAQLGTLLNSLKRDGDYAVRWGGEEFLLVLRPQPRGSLDGIGQRLCNQIANHRFDLGNGQQHTITVSVGLVECPLFPEHPQLLRWDQLVTLADRALYAAKAAGRHRWMAFRPTPGVQLSGHLDHAEGDPGWLVEQGLVTLYGAPCGQPETLSSERGAP